jgi:hypothetical protein
VHDVLDCRNNIFAALPVSPGSAATLVSLLVSDDSTINFGTNWISPGFQNYQLPYLSNTFFGVLNGTNQLLIGDKLGKNVPGFVDVTSTNFYLLTNSAAIDAAGPEAAVVAGSVYDDTLEYVDPTNFVARLTDGPRPDLGAFEGVSTNIAPVALTADAGGPNSLTLTWPGNPIDFVLQQNSAVAGTNWVNVTNAVSTAGYQSQVCLPLQSSAQFFRLRH